MYRRNSRRKKRKKRTTKKPHAIDVKKTADELAEWHPTKILFNVSCEG